jgi:UPF0176 protein
MHEVLLFYKYVTLEDPQAFAAWFRALAERHALTGRALIAEEGVNATLEGLTANAAAFESDMRTDARIADIKIKRSAGTGNAFPKLSVKVRDEIVGTKFPKEVDPRKGTAPRLAPEQLRAWYQENEDFTVVDMRNDYEFLSGHFKDSMNVGLEASRDLPAALEKLAPLKEKKVVTVCTGGVRCEKMSAYLMANGFTDVYQLEDGMHGYMEKYPGKDFKGTLYTFDGRLTMDFGGDREVIGRCHLCSAATEIYVNCGDDTCHQHFLVCTTCKGEEKTYCSEACAKQIQEAPIA